MVSSSSVGSMKSQIHSCRALTLAAAAVFAGCGGSQPSIGAPRAMAQSPAIVQHASHGGSWMLPATSSDLIYATGACGGTCVLSYPTGSLVGTINVGDAGACADTSGNVYIADKNNLFEYAHGGSTPINTFTVSYGIINSCSIDPGTGDIATTVDQTNNYNVAIFSSPSSPPTTYVISFDIQYCGYDNAGDLFVDGYSDRGSDFSFYELPKGGSQFTSISVNPSLQIRPGMVQWDGHYITVEGIGINNGVALYRLSVSGSGATVAGTTQFNGVIKSALQSWIQGSIILIPYRAHGASDKKVGIWKYPAGGKVKKIIKHFESGPDVQAVTFSPGS